MYNDLIETSAAVLSGKAGWTYERSVEYIENIIFNSSIDIRGFLASVNTGSFALFPPARVRKWRKKSARKAPGRARGTGITSLTKDECSRLHEAHRGFFCRNCSFEELRKTGSVPDRVCRIIYNEQRRHQCRLNKSGVRNSRQKDLMYGFVTKQAKREKNWKQLLRTELSDEGLKAFRIH